jgi:hypothetical protein
MKNVSVKEQMTLTPVASLGISVQLNFTAIEYSS